MKTSFKKFGLKCFLDLMVLAGLLCLFFFIQTGLKLNIAESSTISKATGAEYVVDSTETDQGAIGNGKTIKAYVDLIGTSKKATLKFTHRGINNTTTYTVSTSVTIPSNIAVIIEQGAILSDDGGSANFTINGPFEHGLSKCFDWTGSGSVSFGSGAVEQVYPEWWGAIADGTTDCASAIQAAINSLSRGVVKLPAHGTYKTTSQIGGKSFVWLKGTSDYATNIKGVHTEAAVVSFKGVTQSGISDLSLEGDQTTNPKTGLVLGRSSAASAGYHRIINLKIVGYFSVAALYSIASEENTFIKCQIILQGGTAKYAFYTGQFDSLSVESLYPSSNASCQFYGCSIYSWSEEAEDMSTIYMQGGQTLIMWTFRDCYFCTAKDAYVTIDVGIADPFDVPGPIIFDNCNGEMFYVSDKSDVIYGYHFTGSGTINDVDLGTSALRQLRGATTYGVYVDDNVTLKKFKLQSSQAFDVSMYTLDNCELDLSNSNIIIRGNAFGNYIRHDVTKTLTILGSERANFIESASGKGIDEICLRAEQDALKGISSTFVKTDILNFTDEGKAKWNYNCAHFGIRDNVQAKSTDYTVPAALTANIFTNEGASAAVTFTLPAATAGLKFTFVRVASQAIYIDPSGTELIRGGGAGKYILLEGNGTFIEMCCAIDGTWDWIARGTTSHEP